MNYTWAICIHLSIAMFDGGHSFVELAVIVGAFGRN